MSQLTENLERTIEEQKETIAVLDLQLSECSKSYDKLEAIENELLDEVIGFEDEVSRLTAERVALRSALGSIHAIATDLARMTSDSGLLCSIDRFTVERIRDKAAEALATAGEGDPS